MGNVALQKFLQKIITLQSISHPGRNISQMDGKDSRQFLTEDEFREVFNRCRPMFIRIANSYIHDLHIAEDITDESFIKLWEKKDEIFTSNYEAYIFRTIVNRCLDWLKSQNLRTSAQMEIHKTRNMMQQYEITSLRSCDPDRIFASEVERLFWNCIEKMPETTRRIFIANRFEGKTYAEISSMSGLPLRQITSHIQYALKMLRRELKDYISE